MEILSIKEGLFKEIYEHQAFQELRITMDWDVDEAIYQQENYLFDWLPSYYIVFDLYIREIIQGRDPHRERVRVNLDIEDIRVYPKENNVKLELKYLDKDFIKQYICGILKNRVDEDKKI